MSWQSTPPVSEDKQDENEVKKLFQQNPNLIVTDQGKVKCILTGHEMPSKRSAIEQYLSGKKYKRIKLKEKFSFTDFEPMIVPSIKKGHENQLFCKLTLRHINKTAPHVLRHVAGKRYQKAKARWDDCQKTGAEFVPTPRLNKPYRFSDVGGSAERDGNDGSSDDDLSEQDDLSDLYPVKFFEELSLDKEDSGDKQQDVQVKKKSRKRSKPGTKPMKASKPAAKRKKEGLIVHT